MTGGGGVWLQSRRRPGHQESPQAGGDQHHGGRYNLETSQQNCPVREGGAAGGAGGAEDETGTSLRFTLLNLLYVV